MRSPHKPITSGHFDAVLFDLDGVLTSTAKIHSRCWKTMFDDFLGRRSAAGKEPFRPFDIETDYKLYVEVLRAAGILDLFEARVDGLVASRLHLPGKPAPDTFLEAARMLGVNPARAVVVEDAIADVEAGRAGGFGLVVGVDREGGGDALRTHGADVVMTDLEKLVS